MCFRVNSRSFLILIFSSCFLLPSYASHLDINDGSNVKAAYTYEPTLELHKTDESDPDKLSSLLKLLSGVIGIEDISAIVDVTRLGLGVTDAIDVIFTKAFNNTNIDISIDIKHGSDRQLLSLFEIITLRLEQIQNGNKGIQKSLRSLVVGLPQLLRWEIALDTIEDYMTRISNLYHKFSYYQKHRLTVEDHTLLDFADSAVSHGANSIQDLMASIHSMVSPSDPPVLRELKTYGRHEYDIDRRVTTQMSTTLRKKISFDSNDHRFNIEDKRIRLRPSIFQMLEETLQEYEECNYDQSPQQLVFGLYTNLAVTLARGYAMTEFAYNILKYHKKGNFTIERQMSKELYTHYSEGVIRNALAVLKRVPNSFRKCDPSYHIENETFVMITELLQGYIENELDLNPRSSCTGKCSSYKHSKVEGCFLPDTQYCGKHRRCKGQVHDCKFFHADSDVCISSLPYRRYDWVQYENGQVLGVKAGSCQNMMKIDSWWRFLYHCSYCLCLCDDEFSSTSDRYISLKPAVSDISRNMAVTGVRFIKKNRVIHLQVQQGKVLPQGQIYQDSLKWMDVDPITVGTDDFVEGHDYITLRYEKRNIDLDHLTAPKGYVITGVRFRTLGSHINLEAWITPINFTTGKMDPKKSYWISNDNTPVMAIDPRKEIKLYNPDDPRRSHVKSSILSESDMFITLQPTSLNTDVSQLTVPFFDAQPVSPSPASWLEGIQLYHRSIRGYGGFIGFKTFNYNFKRQFTDV